MTGFDPPFDDPAALRTAARLLAGVASELGGQETTIWNARTVAMASWHAPRATDFEAATAGLPAEIRQTAESLRVAGHALSTYATALERARTDLAGLKQHVDAIGADADAQAKRLRPNDPELDRTYQHAGARQAALGAEADQIRRDVDAAAAHAAAVINAETDLVVPGSSRLTPEQLRRHVDSSTGVTDALRNGAGAGRLSGPQAWALLASARRAAADTTAPPPRTDPSIVAEWWAEASPAEQAAYLDSLSAHDDPPLPSDPAALHQVWISLPQEFRNALIQNYPERYGSLDGIPVPDRSLANVQLAHRYIQVVLDQLQVNDHVGASDDWISGHLAELNLTPDEFIGYRNAKACLAGLDNAHGKTGADVYLIVFDPWLASGDGRAAIAIGNPDTADNTAVVVPGLNQKIENHMSNSDAINLFKQARQSDRWQTTAVINWMGYDAPNFTNVGADAAARHGASLLAADVAALRATHDGIGHLTVIGHSYGSTTVADACVREGMRPDDVVLIGSPGVDAATTAADLGIGAGHVFVGSASRDPVTKVPSNDREPLGVDPASGGFGGTRFHAESVHRGGDLLVAGLPVETADHSRYFEVSDDVPPRPSESLQNIGDVVTGRGDTIRHDGELADARTRTRLHKHPGPRGGAAASGGTMRDPEGDYQPRWGDPSQ